MRDKVWGVIGASIGWIAVAILIIWSWKEGATLVKGLMIVLGILNALSYFTDNALIQSTEGHMGLFEGLLIGVTGFLFAAYVLGIFWDLIPEALEEFYWPIEGGDKK